MNKKDLYYVALNTVPDKRTGMYLLLHSTEAGIVAFGLSHADAVRAQQNGAAYLGRQDAKNLIAQIA